MAQNRNKLIELLISNLSNSIVHSILEKSIDKEELSEKYRKELVNSFEIAKRYREKINPKEQPLLKDSSYIKDKLKQRVKSELLLRISKGYQIDLSLIDLEIENALKRLNV